MAVALWKERGLGGAPACASTRAHASVAGSRDHRSLSGASSIWTPDLPPKITSCPSPTTTCECAMRAGGDCVLCSIVRHVPEGSSGSTCTDMPIGTRASASPPRTYSLLAIALTPCEERAQGAAPERTRGAKRATKRPAISGFLSRRIWGQGVRSDRSSRSGRV